MTTPVTVTAGFDRCLEPDCTAAPTATFLVTFSRLTVQCGVCDGHVGVVDQLRALGATASEGATP